MVSQAKGYKLQTQDVAWLLGFVHAMARHPCRQLLREPTSPFDVRRISRAVEDENLQSILYALQLRRAFGGMAGDMKYGEPATRLAVARNRCCIMCHASRLTALRFSMFDCCTEFFLESFSGPSPGRPTKYGVEPLPPQNIKPLAASEWELSAIDFHCSDIDIRLGKACGEHLVCWACRVLPASTDRPPPLYPCPAAAVLEGEDVRGLIWHHSSKITNKQLLQKGTRADAVASSQASSPTNAPLPSDPASKLWAKVLPVFRRLARQILQGRR